MPVAAVGVGRSAVLGAAVPETPINENCQPLAPEHEVRLAGQRLVTAPAGDALRPQNVGQSQFCVAVAAGPDGSHDL